MKRRVTVLACLVTALLTSTASPAVAAATGDYVALGDSYSSGVGAPGQTGSCSRSPSSYPGLFAAAHDPASYTLVACGGATTDTLRATQLSALSTGTDLVSLTIGGNDVGFAPTVLTCTLSSQAACTAAVEEALDLLETTIPTKLDATYADIRTRAPNATVVVLGYPVLFAETPSCALMSLPKRQALNRGARALNAVIQARAQAAGFVWSDVTDEFAGHGICSSAPYLNGLVLIPASNSFHPNADGYRYGYLPALEDVAS
ncbi:SGNH/GDSL hydrolase family protein [Actinoplanes sp. RD1]|uniref:SGNH/GDSL hydrolase family protein n=1 Tax=Actinoplanes sp. RD1 TaxID=3064538 RepID=UPI00274057C5|nr:SGNH/GDSL hydrolase family protein [Actinoplanes sp. RD1]